MRIFWLALTVIFLSNSVQAQQGWVYETGKDKFTDRVSHAIRLVDLLSATAIGFGCEEGDSLLVTLLWLSETHIEITSKTSKVEWRVGSQPSVESVWNTVNNGKGVSNQTNGWVLVDALSRDGDPAILIARSGGNFLDMLVPGFAELVAPLEKYCPRQ